MIVKDEAKILTRLALTVRDHIDYWTVVDTGSTDNTRDMVERLFGQMPGQLLEHAFDGYGPSRTYALRAAEPHTDWMLVLDADDTFHGEIDLGTTADCIEAEMRQGGMRFWLPKLLRSNRGWESRGRTHEYYVSPISSPPVRTTSFYVQHHGDGTGRAEKFDRDIKLLTQDWDEEPNGRTAFYLARSYDDMGHQPDAIDWYRTRINLGGWEEETFYAHYRLGVNLLSLGAKQEGVGHLWSAWGLRSHRCEPLVALAEHYRQSQQWVLAWTAASLAQDFYQANEPGLFVDIAMEWRIPYEVSIAAWYVGHPEKGKKALHKLLGRDDIPEPFQSSVQANKEFYFGEKTHSSD
jgi:hypothetical protein